MSCHRRSHWHFLRYPKWRRFALLESRRLCWCTRLRLLESEVFSLIFHHFDHNLSITPPALPLPSLHFHHHYYFHHCSLPSSTTTAYIISKVTTFYTTCTNYLIFNIIHYRNYLQQPFTPYILSSPFLLPTPFPSFVPLPIIFFTAMHTITVIHTINTVPPPPPPPLPPTSDDRSET